MSNKILFVLLIYLLCCSRLLYAAPAITVVSGAVTDNSSVTVSGSSFGSGPTVELFEPYEGGTTGNNIPADGARYGAWTSVSAYPPIYDAEAHSGAHGARIFDHDNDRQHQSKKVFSSPCTEVFVSYWVRVPNGTTFPRAATVQTFPSASAWKFGWLEGSDHGYQGDDDMCIPTYTSTNTIQFAGNDYTPNFNLGVAWWSWTEWMRLTLWLKADPTNPSTVNGTFWFQSLTGSGGISTQSKTDATVFDTDDNAYDDATFQWDRVTFPGWLGSPVNGDCRPVYDDIYIASGANAQARVEIGNNSNYASCTNLSICIPTAWADNSITITLNQGSFANCETVYLFVVDADGNVNTQGYPIRIVTGAGNPPCPPIGLKRLSNN